MKKLDLKNERRLRRIAYLDWIGQLSEIAFSSNVYTREVLKNYSTSTKIRRPTGIILLILWSTLIIYAFLDKKTPSKAIHKNQCANPLKYFHTKCASYDSNSKLRAKLAFTNCKMSQEETLINFLSRSEQKANEARNFDITISDNNMKNPKTTKKEYLLLQLKMHASHVWNC